MNTALAMRVTLQRAIRYSPIENRTFYLRQGSDEGKDREGFAAVIQRCGQKERSVRAKAVPATAGTQPKQRPAESPTKQQQPTSSLTRHLSYIILTSKPLTGSKLVKFQSWRKKLLSVRKILGDSESFAN